MTVFVLVCYMLAALCFALSAMNKAALVPLGLLAWVLVPLSAVLFRLG